MDKQARPSQEILALPRAKRRAIYLAAYRTDPSVRWEPYRRWDGGAPNILGGLDALRIREANRKARKEAAATGKLLDPALRQMSMLWARMRGLTAHRIFRRKTA